MRTLRAMDAKRERVEIAVTVGLAIWILIDHTWRNHFSSTLLVIVLLVCLNYHLIRAASWYRSAQEVEYNAEMMRKLVGRMPSSFDSLGEDANGDRMVAVTRNNGEVVTVAVPFDYDPTDDSYERIVREVCPEMFHPAEGLLGGWHGGDF